MARSPFLYPVDGYNIPFNVFHRGKYVVYSGGLDAGVCIAGREMCLGDAYLQASAPFFSMSLLNYEWDNAEYFLFYPDLATSPTAAVSGGMINFDGVVISSFWRSSELKLLNMKVASELGATKTLDYLARLLGVYKTNPLVLPEPVVEKPVSVWNEAYPTEW